MEEIKIEWAPEFDRHVKGRSPLGDVWLRLGRDGKVLGVYLMLRGGVEKLVPVTEVQETQPGAKQLAEDRLLEIELWER